MPGMCHPYQEFAFSLTSTTEHNSQGSSLGNYTTQWLNEFHWSARGESAEDWLDEPKKRREKLPLPPVNIVFPTKATVQKSQLGEQVRCSALFSLVAG